MQRLSDEESQLLSVLTRSRDSNGALPIVVKVAQLEDQLLVFIRTQIGLVPDDVVVDRRNSALVNELRHHVEVIALRSSDNRIDNGAGRRIDERIVGHLLEETDIDALRDDDERQCRLIVAQIQLHTDFGKSLLHEADLLIAHERNLAISAAVSVDDHAFGSSLLSANHFFSARSTKMPRFSPNSVGFEWSSHCENHLVYSLSREEIAAPTVFPRIVESW